MAKERTRYIHINDGGILAVKSGEFFYLTCCDCCLCHRVDISVVGGKEVRIAVERDERRTAQKRRRTKERLAATAAESAGK